MLLSQCAHKHRVMLLGAPSSSNTADALTSAAKDIAQRLAGQSSQGATMHDSDSLQGLLQVLMWGLASLTHAQLHVAVTQIMRLMGQPVQDAVVSELSQQMRYAAAGCAGTTETISAPTLGT